MARTPSSPPSRSTTSRSPSARRIDDTGAIRSLAFDRWGDPDNTGTWGWHPCGGEVTCETRFDGLAIPSAGSFGWHYGTNRWPDGEFFRYRITAMTT